MIRMLFGILARMSATAALENAVTMITAMAIVIASWRVVDHPENYDYIMAGVDDSKQLLAWLLDGKSAGFHASLRKACG